VEGPEEVIACALIAAAIYGAAHAGFQVVSQAHGRSREAAIERTTIDSNSVATPSPGVPPYKL